MFASSLQSCPPSPRLTLHSTFVSTRPGGDPLSRNTETGSGFLQVKMQPCRAVDPLRQSTSRTLAHSVGIIRHFTGAVARVIGDGWEEVNIWTPRVVSNL